MARRSRNAPLGSSTWHPDRSDPTPAPARDRGRVRPCRCHGVSGFGVFTGAHALWLLPRPGAMDRPARLTTNEAGKPPRDSSAGGKRRLQGRGSH